MVPQQALSHFTFERSGHKLIVVDIQGVGDLYTDPQIHTASGAEYGDGNLGTQVRQLLPGQQQGFCLSRAWRFSFTRIAATRSATASASPSST